MTAELSSIEKSELIALVNEARKQAQPLHDQSGDHEISRLASVTMQMLAGWIKAITEGTCRLLGTVLTMRPEWAYGGG
jgi:hypothetical protein